MFFVEGFEDILRSCMGLLMDEKIRANVIRVLNIWSDRSIYRQSFIQELKSAVPYSETVSNESSATTKIMAEFKMRDVIDAVNRLQSLESETSAKMEEVKGAKLAALNGEILNHLKDKTLGDHLIREADEASRLLQSAIVAIEREQRHRQNLIECLNKALVYSVVQNNEVDDEFKAYVRIGQNAAKVLTILTTPGSSSSFQRSSSSFPPLPGDVPSPTNSDDGPVLPSDPVPGKHTSSLDQRLQTILCAMKGPPPEIPHPIGGYTSAASHDQDSRTGMMSTRNVSNTHIPPPGTSRITAQPIQSLVSARSGISQPSVASAFGPTENCEPADMDITNSDEEEYVPGPRGPNLRVIEPVRSVGELVAEQRRMPDIPASYITKPRSRDNPENGAWHRMAGERLISPRSQHPSTSAPVPISGHRWNPPPSRVAKHNDHNEDGRQGSRRAGAFRHH